jgi:hypothetical protein
MMRFISTCAIAVALAAATANAQDSTVKSKTKVTADDARTMTMTGCLGQGPTAGSYLLSGAMAATGEDVTVKSKTKTDVDRNDTKVKTKARTTVDDATVGTAGTATVYDVTPRAGVNLASYIGQRVQITAVMLDPATRFDDDADVKIKDKTKVKTDDAPDRTLRSRTKVELPRGAYPRLTAVSVRTISPDCS